MELPHLGKNCALKQCNQLDFLPVKCDACSEIFCLEHYKYDSHSCIKAKNKDNQVPVCPICSKPVVHRRGQLPDIAVSEHLDLYCSKNELIKNTVKPAKSNLQSCNFKSCKQKDLIYLECTDCRQKFCVKHRHPTDHTCPGPRLSANIADNWNNFKGQCSSSASSGLEILKNRAQQISRSGQAALNRITNSRRNDNQQNRNQNVTSLQGNLSEQEALAIAISESQANGTNALDKTTNQYTDEDEALARAIQASELEARSRQGDNKRDNCILS